MRLPTLNIGMIDGGKVTNAIPGTASFSIDLRSTDGATQAALLKAIDETTQRVAKEERVTVRIERASLFDYAKALPPQQRRDHTLTQTTVAAMNHFRKPGSATIAPKDLGSTDANVAVSMGIPAVATGVALSTGQHQLEESAEASSIVPGTKALIALMVALAGR